MTGSFDPIGPYSLSRWDMWIAGLHITFRVAALWFRLLYGAIYLALAISLWMGIATQSWILVGANIGVCLVFLLGPALRSKRDLTNIVLRPVPEGIEVENNRVRTICKWPMIRKPCAVGQYLYVPIGVRIAFAIRQDVTTPANLAALRNYVEAGIADLDK